MIRLLERAADEFPGQVAVVTATESATYSVLVEDAHRTAAGLRKRRITSFAIVESDVRAVITLLAAAALVGAEPCQYQADIAPSELAAQAAGLGHDIVVERRADLAASFSVLTPESLVGPAYADLPVSDTQPLMIRTTGTTGAPKAARHDWGVLARTVEKVQPRPEQRWLLAYGPHQFAGIQVMQHVAASRATLIAPFPRGPRDGLAAMVEHGVTCVSATPTYWRFLLAEARSRAVQLPPLEQITLGGEASPADLLEELRTAFPSARISQVYASTEFGSVVSVKDGRPGLSVETLFSEANPTSAVRVHEGELWVRANAGMLGYVETSAPSSSDDTSLDDWRPTGDLVEIVDGRVFFRGRRSEVINVGGVKVHPLPVEERISALGRVAMARVFGRENRLTGAIVAAEVVPVVGINEVDLEELREEVRDAVADLPRAWHPRSITFVDTIETRGDKTVRRIEA